MAGQRLARFIPKSRFVRNVGILTGGTVFAQGLAALALPILTRMYTPADFSLLAVYMSLLSLFTVISCLRFNIAIPLPEDDGDAINLVALSLLAALGSSVILAIPVLVDPTGTATLLGQPYMETYLWMVPLGVFMASVYSAFQYWASRKKRFGIITKTRMSRATGGAGAQLGFGAISPSPFGLIFGHMIYGGLGIIGLARSMWREDRTIFTKVRWGGVRRNARHYNRFPIYSVPEALFNTAGIQVPIIIIAAMAAGPEAGFLLLAMKVMGLPMGLVGSSVAQVYLAEAPSKLRSGTLTQFTRRNMLTLLKMGGAPLVAVGIASPLVFPYVFGEEWLRAGVAVAWMTPWFVLQFIASPISMVLHVTDNQLAAMLLQAFGLVLRVAAVFLTLQLAETWVIEVFALSGAMFYALYIAVILSVLSAQEKKTIGGN
ncbi:polysaccharide biosynthesis protein [Litchfieldella qijiaojingensis]|uniref:Polysaccharide biosynthesis protein n=1 Tax=Litchfieldella qijiaojingensis TaxID=980347 RepID=A0ABQ2ZAN0_9GAMM|nr:lipopolysaccharide biosynthesis protein [Halomonas qijiaojingensis]GGY10146.1 polysaccharide biosynthesis protein [Halomonas qijiaojingensis]